MPEYYFDIETNSEGPKPDLTQDSILTLQYQKLSTELGYEEGKLQILKSWESSEEAILKQFYEIFQPNKGSFRSFSLTTFN